MKPAKSQASMDWPPRGWKDRSPEEHAKNAKKRTSKGTQASKARASLLKSKLIGGA